MRKKANATSALTDIASPIALQNAWKAISAGKLGKPTAERRGHDGVSLIDFSRHQESSILQLAQQLRSGSFSFSPLDAVTIPKGGNKYRVICIPTVNDRVVQRAILDQITSKQKWMANPISYGFVAHGGVQKAVQRAIKYRNNLPWVFKTDITKFFDNIDREALKDQVIKKIQQRSIRALLFNAIDSEIGYRNRAEERRLATLGINKGKGVRQGMPLSPFFANLFLADFDKKCHAEGIRAIRYADDLVFFSDSETGAHRIKEMCLEELKKISLSIPELGDESKSQICAPDQATEFLGVEIRPIGNMQYVIEIGRETQLSIKTEILSLGNLSELKARGINIEKFGSAITARVSAYRATYAFCSNHNQFSVRLDQWSAKVRRKVATQLGIKVETLSPEGKWFLGLE